MTKELPRLIGVEVTKNDGEVIFFGNEKITDPNMESISEGEKADNSLQLNPADDFYTERVFNKLKLQTESSLYLLTESLKELQQESISQYFTDTQLKNFIYQLSLPMPKIIKLQIQDIPMESLKSILTFTDLKLGMKPMALLQESPTTIGEVLHVLGTEVNSKTVVIVGKVSQYIRSLYSTDAVLIELTLDKKTNEFYTKSSILEPYPKKKITLTPQQSVHVMKMLRSEQYEILSLPEEGRKMVELQTVDSLETYEDFLKYVEALDSINRLREYKNPENSDMLPIEYIVIDARTFTFKSKAPDITYLASMLQSVGIWGVILY